MTHFEPGAANRLRMGTCHRPVAARVCHIDPICQQVAFDCIHGELLAGPLDNEIGLDVQHMLRIMGEAS